MTRAAAWGGNVEIDSADFHIPSPPAATASVTSSPQRKEPRFPLPFDSFRLIFRLEKTERRVTTLVEHVCKRRSGLHFSRN
jgi:hypothetical protein